jgi:hypothetical protein
MTSLLRRKPTSTSKHIDSTHIHINKQLIQHMSANTAVYLTALMHLDECAKANTNAWEPNSYKYWFKLVREEVQNLTMLSFKQQASAIQTLKELRIIKVKRIGMPAVNMCYINVDQLFNLYGIAHGEYLEGGDLETQLSR